MKSIIIGILIFIFFVIIMTILISISPSLAVLLLLGFGGYFVYSVYQNLGGIVASLGFHQQALNILNNRIQRNPQDALAYSQRATTRFALGDANGALDDYELSLKHDIVNLEKYTIRKGVEATLRTEMAQVLFSQGNYEAALKQLVQASEIKSDFHPTLAWIAATHYALGDKPEAYIWWSRACESHPKYRSLDGSNWIHSELGWTDQEIEFARQIFGVLNSVR